jgi:hypothetical protein
VCGVGAGERVDDVEILAVEVRDDLRAQPVEALLLERLVDRAPPDSALGPGLADDELVLGRAAGEAARVDDEGTALGERRLSPGERMRIEQ